MEANTQLSKLLIIDEQQPWNQALSNFKTYDVYYTYEYCRWNARIEGGQAKLIFFRSERGSVIYPIIVRNIPDTNGKLFDITSPYGYSGPLVFGDVSIVAEFASVFRTYCMENNIISEIIRLHPLLGNANYLGGYCKLKYIRKTTAVDLSPDLQSIRGNYSSMNKRNIKKALKQNLQCKVVEKNEENISIFMNLYQSTMDRKHAEEYYYFDFSTVKDQLVNTAISNSYLLFVFHGERVVSSVILFTSKDLAHYHLGASDERYLDLRPNNLIFDYMVQVSKELGCRLLHLGGGYQENDSLFQFKSSFTNGNHYDFVLGTNIYNAEIYEELVEKARSQSDLNDGFFPLYRSR